MLALLRLTLQLFTCLHLDKQQQAHAKKRRSNKAKRSNESAFYSFRKYQKAIANVILISYITMPGALLADGLSAAAGSSNAPTFDTSASGVPIVNITAPSSQGVSRNEYENLNVDSIGLIFNNATGIVDTDLAGYIDGNASLNGNSASIILNEVTGNSHSALNGYMEIAGQQAELVIANRHGITCNGCGFINTTRGVLTTGEAVINNGALQGYNVAQGQVTIEGLGLNSVDTEQIDILARSIAVNGELWANNAALVTGQNNITHTRDSEDKLTIRTLTDEEIVAGTVETDSTEQTPESESEIEDASETPPTFTLDVAAIGGMYANRIILIGTEAGLGVNFDGNVTATEEMVLTANGEIVNNASITANILNITGEHANSTLNNQAVIAANDLTIDITSIENKGGNALILGHEALTIDGDNLANETGAVIYSLADNASITLTDTLTNSSATIESSGNLTIDAKKIINKRDGEFVVVNTIVTSDPQSSGSGKTRGYIYYDKELRDIINEKETYIESPGGESSEEYEVTAYVLSESKRNKLISAGIAAGKIGIRYSTTVVYTQTTNTPTAAVNNANAGQIITAGNLTLTTHNGDGIGIDNLYSTITSGGTLSSTGKLNNQAFAVDQVISRSGTKEVITDETECTGDGDDEECDKVTVTSTENYNPPDIKNNTVLASAIFTANEVINASGDIVNTGGESESIAEEKTDDVNESESTLLNADNAMFEKANDDSAYLYETNPAFTNYNTFVSSDYFIDTLGLNNRDTKRVGDGFYEQQLIKEQLIDLTGLQFLNEQNSAEDQYMSLMDNALTQYESINLIPGTALTDEQRAGLTQPIVWMVEEQVETDSGLQTVLVPRVYLPSSMDMLLRSDGAMIASNTINIDAGDLDNSGSIIARESLSINAENINNTGLLTAEENLNLTAANDITSTGGNISGDNVTLDAGNDVTLAGSNVAATADLNITAANDINLTAIATTKTTGFSDNLTTTTTHQTSSLTAANINLNAGNTITSEAANIAAAEEINLSASDINLLAVADTTSNKKTDQNARITSTFSESSTTHQVTALNANNINIKATNDVTTEGTQIDANGDVSINAENINLFSVVDNSNTASYEGSGSNYSKSQSHNENAIGTNITSNGSLSLAATEDIYSEGSSIAAENGIALTAGGDVTLAAVMTTQSASSKTQTKKSGFFGSKTTVTSSSSEDIEQIGTALTSNGDIQITSGDDVILYASTAQAKGSIDVDAGGEVQLLAAVNQVSDSYESEKKGTFKIKTQSTGSVTQTAVGSGLIANGDVTVQSDESINLEGATLSSGETLALSATGEEAQSVTLNDDGNYVNADGELVGNITLGTQELHSSSWDESSSSYRGIAKELVKFTTFVAASNFMEVEVEIGQSDAVRTDYVTQAVTSVQANDLDIDATNDVALIGTDVYVANNADINANNVTIDAALETTTHSESHTDKTMTSDGASFSKEKGEVTLMSLSSVDYTDQTTTTTGTWQGATLDVGNLNINAEENVAIIASDILVENDANIEGSNVLVSGREDSVETNTKSITKTDTLTVGVKNAYVDVAFAVKALNDAKNDVLDATSKLNEARKEYANGFIEKEDLLPYMKVLASATKNAVEAGKGVALSYAQIAATSSTYGFSASGSVSTKTDESSIHSTQGTWSGASLNIGGNTNLSSENELTIQGSEINSSGEISIDAGNVSIVAGTNTTTEVIDKSSEGKTISANTGGSVSASTNSSESTSSSEMITSVTSSLNGDRIVIRSDNDLIVEGADVTAIDALSIEAQNVSILAAHNTSSENSETSSKSVSVGYSDGAVSGAIQSSKGKNDNQSDIYIGSNLSGGSVNIKSENQLLVQGSNIAAKDDLNIEAVDITITEIIESNNSSSDFIKSGFTASNSEKGGVSAGVDLSQEKNSSQSTASMGSSLSGGNITLVSDNDLTIKGSNVNATEILNLDAINISVLAGTNAATERSKSTTVNATGTSNSEDKVNATVGASKSSSSSNNLSYENSSLTAGTIISTSDSLTIKGGNINADVVDIDTGTLIVESLQDASSSKSKSIGAGIGGADDLTSISGEASKAYSDSNWVNSQSGITGGTVKITAIDTRLTGSVIAAVDDRGNTTEQLTLVTDTLTITNIKDTSEGQSMGADITWKPKETTVGANYDSHDYKQDTLSTIGLGNVTVGGENFNEVAEDINRDTTTSQLITQEYDSILSFDIKDTTIDNKWFTGEGFSELKNDLDDFDKDAQEVYDNPKEAFYNAVDAVVNEYDETIAKVNEAKDKAEAKVNEAKDQVYEAWDKVVEFKAEQDEYRITKAEEKAEKRAEGWSELKNLFTSNND